MKKLALLLALIMCGCTHTGETPPKVELRFQVRDVVDLKIGGQGQIIRIVGISHQPYLVRIRTDDGVESVWFNEFELEIK